MMSLNVAPDSPSTVEAALTHLTRRVERLYSLPGAALQIVQLASQEEVSARALKDAIEMDPALTAKILAVVNSSLFGLRGRIIDLHRAIAMIGTKSLQLLALGLSLPRNLLDVEVDLLSNFWRMCLSKSVAAKELSRRFYSGRFESETFIAALLQDVGMLVLMQQLQGPYTELLLQTRETNSDLLELERRAMGFDHAAVSASLLQSWGLPDAIVHATKLPLNPQGSSELSSDDLVLVEILSWADLYGRFMSGQTRLMPQLREIAARNWQLEREIFDQFLRELDDHVRALAVAYGIDARSWPDLTLLIQEAFSALAHVAEHNVREWLGSPAMMQALHQMQSCDQGPAVDGELAQSPSVPASQSPTQFVDGTSTSSKPVDLDLVCESAPNNFSNTTSSAKAYRLPRNVDPQRGAMDGQVLARIAAAADVCRRARQPLSLMLCELDRHDEMLAFGGGQRLQRLVDFIEQSIVEGTQPRAGGMSLGDARFAVVLENCDRAAALQYAREATDRVRREAPPCGLPGGWGVSLSVGVASLAVPPRNFAPEDLLAASHRCLYAAISSGGGMIKSIDLM